MGIDVMPAGSMSAQADETERVAHECPRLDDEDPSAFRFGLGGIAKTHCVLRSKAARPTGSAGRERGDVQDSRLPLSSACTLARRR